MRNWAILLLLVSSLCWGQTRTGGGNAGGVSRRFAGVPSGACVATDLAVDTTTGTLYSCNATVWQVISSGGGAVSSVFTRTGAVAAGTGDYTAAQVTNALDTSVTQTANKVYAGPTSGGAAAPTFRLLVAGDVPATSTLWSGLGDPTGNLGLTMGSNTSTFTFNATTGSSDLFKITDTSSNSGTGALFSAIKAAGSSTIPVRLKQLQNSDTQPLLQAENSNAAVKLGLYPGDIGGTGTARIDATGGAFLLTRGGTSSQLLGFSGIDTTKWLMTATSNYDGATGGEIGFLFNNLKTITSSVSLLSVQNNGTEIFSVKKAGIAAPSITFPDATVQSTAAASTSVNAQTGTTYTVLSTDSGKLVTFNNASAQAITLPQATTTGFGSGFFLYVESLGAGVVTITPTTSTINGASSVKLTQDKGLIIFSDGTNYQVKFGTSNFINTVGTNNTFVGSSTGNLTTTGTGQNTALGVSALTALGTASNDTAVGYQSLFSITNTATQNTAVGSQSLKNNITATGNTAVGYLALRDVGAAGNGASNTAVGWAAGNATTTGANNVAIGSGAMQNAVVTGSSNVAIGSPSAIGLSSGSENVMIGNSSGGSITTGSDNITIGNAGFPDITTGSKNISIGYNVNVPTNTGSNQMTLGNLIYATGLDGTTSTISTGSVGVGVKVPNTKLDVNGFINTTGQKRVSTQFDKASDTTLANITGLSITVTAGRTYHFVATLHVTGDVVGGQKYAIGGTATATNIIYEISTISNAANAIVISSKQTALGGSAGQAGAIDDFTKIEGTITVNAGGTLTAQFAENAASGTSSVLAGSTFIAEDIQ